MLMLFFWLVATAAIVLLLGFAKLFNAKYDWKLFPAIWRARAELREVARKRVPNANIFSVQEATAIDSRLVDFWITTDTDKERDLLAADPEIYIHFCDALARAGYPPSAITGVHFRIQSQETVDREYGGRWREATSMP